MAVAYVIAAAGIIQLASAVFPAWEMPNWVLRLVIVLLLVGFPIALVLAWAFDVTPRGIQATPAVSSAARGPRRRNVLLLVALGLTIAVAVGFFLLPRVTARRIEKSVAVLPFENYSSDPNNAYFADGIQDDILTALSRIRELKVISRTSVMGYRNSSKNVREIGKALGAGAILEGSVRSEGKRVRVNVQLINAENDEHIWANEYDRDLTDVFAIQSDLAREIAGALQAKLSPSEAARIAHRPTENGEAYLAFVQARDLQWAIDDMAKMKQAEQLYARAIKLDPNFALAYAGYSQLESWLYHTWDPSTARRDHAQSLATRALELQPQLPEAHLALGFSYYYGNNQYDAALREFEIARQGLPNSMEVYLAIGAIQRRQGHWARSNASLEKAATLGPKDTWALQNLAFNYEMQRDFPRAQEAIDRALRLQPNAFSIWQIKARIAIEARGDFSVAEEMIAKIEKLPNEAERAVLLCETRGGLLLRQRKFAEAAQLAASTPDAAMAQQESLADKYIILGHARRGLQDDAGAKAAFTKAKEIIEASLTTRPDNVDVRARLGHVLACLGEKERALTQAQVALDLLPVSKDAFHGPDILMVATEIYVLTGENDRALESLERLLSIPSLITAETLKIDPVWDPLRNDPRFQQLLTRPPQSA